MAGSLERVAVLVDVRHLVSQEVEYGAVLEGLMHRVVKLGGRNTLWGFKFFDSAVSSFRSRSRILSWIGDSGTRCYWQSSYSSLYNSEDERFATFRSCVEKAMQELEKEKECCMSESRPDNVVRTVQEAITDFSWEPLLAEGRECENDGLFWSQPNLMLLLVSSAAAERFGCPNLTMLTSRRIHLCLVQPPGKVSRPDVAITNCFWGCTSVDTILISSLLVPPRLAVEFIAPVVLPLENKCCAKLHVKIQGQEQFVCRLNVAFSQSQLSLHSCSKMVITIQSVVPRCSKTFQALSKSEEFLIYGGADKQATCDGSLLREEMIQRLLHLPHECVLEHPQLQLLLLFIAQMDGIGLVNVHVTDTRDQSRRCLQGVLDPLTVYTARLTVGEAEVFTCTKMNKSLGRQSPSKTEHKVEAASWDEAWSSFKQLVNDPEEYNLRALTWDELVYRDYNRPRWLKVWFNQERKRFRKRGSGASTPLTDLSQATEDFTTTSSATPASESSGEAVWGKENASAYLSSLKEKLDTCLTSEGLELPSFVRTIVSQTISAVKLTSVEDEENKPALFQELKSFLLVQPKKLSAKYKKSNFPDEHRVKEYALQIKLRMEVIIAATPPSDEQNALIEEICELLSVVQFHLPGGVFQEEQSLLNFANRVVQSSYKDELPNVVQEIYAQMEFGGYCDESEAASESEPELGQEPETATEPTSAENEVEVLQEDEGDMNEEATFERGMLLSHFSSKAQKLRYVMKSECTTKKRTERTALQELSSNTTKKHCFGVIASSVVRESPERRRLW